MTLIVRGLVRSYATKQPQQPKFKPLKSSLFQPPLREGAQDFKNCSRVGDQVGVATIESPVNYQDSEMQQREANARQVKHTIAPISNKGAYQVITNQEDFKTMGRKV